MAEQPYPARFYGNPVGPANPGPGVPLPEAEAPLPVDVPLPPERPAPAPAKLYYEGDVVEDGKGNQKILKDGAWQDHVSVGRDIKKSIIPSAIRGITGVATTPATGADLLAKGMEWAADKVLPEKAAQSYKDTSDAVTNWSNKSTVGRAVSALMGPTYNEAIEGIESKTGPLYKAQTVPGKYVETATEFAPGVLAGPGAWQAKIAQGLGMAFGSETAKQLFEGSDYEKVASLLGGMYGAKIPASIRRLVTPLPADAARTSMENLLARRNVQTTAGQATGNDFVGMLENRASESMGAPAHFKNLGGNQGRQVTRAMMEESGAAPVAPTRANPSPTLSGRDLARRGDELSTQIEALTRRNDMMFDPQLRGELNNAVREYTRAVGLHGPGGGQNPVQDAVNRILWGGQGTPPSRNVSPMGLSGQQYQSERSFLSQRAQSGQANADRNIAFRAIRDALDSAMERTLATRNPTDLGAFRDFRRQYSAYQALSEAASLPGPNARLGILDPSHVFQAAQGNPLNRNLAELAGAGEALLQPLPNRSATQDAIASLGGMVGGLVGHSTGGIPVGLESALVGMFGIPHMIAALMKSPPMAKALLSPGVQGHLKNQRWLPGAGTTTNRGQMIRALLMNPESSGIQ